MDTRYGADPLARARDLAAAIAAAADTIERTRRIPEPLLSELHRSRLFRMLLPRSVGGDQVEPGAYLAAIEEIGPATTPRWRGVPCRQRRADRRPSKLGLVNSVWPKLSEEPILRT